MNGSILLPEFDHETANTRKTLERIPDEHLAFRPHEKSWTLLQLGGHVANLVSWSMLTLTTDELDMEQPFERPALKSRDDMLHHFDANVREARKAIAAASSEDLVGTWTLRAGEHVVLAMPRMGVLRSFVLNHMIHHRAQLTVYLRMLDVPVPALYGPSADES